MTSKNPLISVCIPVFSTEPYLLQCLRSVFTQDFDSFEVVVVSDASRGRDQKGRSAKKIVRLAQKESNKFRKENGLQKIPLRFTEHKENRGLIEVRRTLCYEARGFYMTQVDSDDQMAPGALSALYGAAKIPASSAGMTDMTSSGESGVSLSGEADVSLSGLTRQSFDIIHGTSTAGRFDENGTFIPAQENRFGKIFYGTIQGHDVFRRWLLNGDFTANTWGKLIKRGLWLRAYENIPYTECNMADDVLLFFFLGQYAKSYIGIESKVYLYRVGTGMTSGRKIDTLHKWKMVCSAASVFSVISTWIEEGNHEIAADEIEKIRWMTRYYLANNLRQMHDTVVPELHEEARAMLCDYWGRDFVEIAESAVKGGK